MTTNYNTPIIYVDQKQLNNFPRNAVNLYPSDFYIGGTPDSSGKLTPYDLPTRLRRKDCVIILFYDPTKTDPELFNIWNKLSNNIRGVFIAAVNIVDQVSITDAFLQTSASLDSPLRNYGINGPTTIMVYRGGYPKAYYNGELSYSSLESWILQRACNPSYVEFDMIYASNQITVNNVPSQSIISTPIEITPPVQVQQTASSEYVQLVKDPLNTQIPDVEVKQKPKPITATYIIDEYQV